MSLYDKVAILDNNTLCWQHTQNERSPVLVGLENLKQF